MKLHPAISVIAALTVSMLAHADAPARPSVPPPALVQVEAILAFCSDIDPADAAAYHQLLRLITGHQSDRDAGGKIEGFHHAVDAFSDTLEALPRQQAIKTCKAGIAK